MQSTPLRRTWPGGAGIAIGDAVVLAQLLRDGVSLDDLSECLAARRFERAEVGVKNALQLSPWEQEGGPPNPQAPVPTAQSFAKLAEPI